MDVRQRFLRGLADAAALEHELLERSGTSIRGNEERRGSGIVVWYRAGEQSLIWCDPESIDRFADLADPERFVDRETVAERATNIGLACVASAQMRVLATSKGAPEPVDSRYRQHWLRSDEPAHFEAVKAFADRSDPDDVEDAALDELDDIDGFDEQAINVLTVADPASGSEFGSDSPSEPSSESGLDGIVAYASAVEWSWDPGFSDIGVLIDRAHRGRGLGTQVVAHTVARLQADGKLPLYRHGLHNTGSQRIAELNGFEEATSLSFFCPPED